MTKDPDQEALIYQSSKVSWAAAEFLETPQGRSARLLVYILIALLLAGAVFAAFTQFAVTITARGELVTEKAIFSVRAPANMKVARLNVTEYQSVRDGEALIVGEEQFSDDEYASISKQIKQLRAILDANSKSKCPECLTQLHGLAENVFQQHQTVQFKELVAPIQQSIRDWVASLDGYGHLSELAAGIRKQIELDRQKLAEIDKKKPRQNFAAQIEQLNDEIASFQSEIVQRKQKLNGDLLSVQGKLEAQLSDLTLSIDRIRTQQSINAPLSGVVTSLKVGGVGQLLNEGQELLNIVPKDAALLAEIGIANKDIARIRPNMPVKVKLDALPEREFSSVDGIVKYVPPTASAASGPGSGTVYKVRIALTKQSFQKAGADYPFRLGMTLSGYVIIEHHSLLYLAFDKVFNWRDAFVGASVD